MGEVIFYIFCIIAISFFWGRKGEADEYGEVEMTDYKLRDINAYAKNWGK